MYASDCIPSGSVRTMCYRSLTDDNQAAKPIQKLFEKEY